MRVWFNHWFSTAYHIIGLMKERGDLYVIGSNKDPRSVVRLACDEWYTEPTDISGEEYVSFCLDFCREHRIEVFVPRREMTAIADNADKFAGIGVKLLQDRDPKLLHILKDKAKTYRYFSAFAPETVPLYFEAKSLDGFENACTEVTKKYARACFKLADDEGAVSFRVIDNAMEDAGGLYRAPGMKISMAAAEKILSAYSFNAPLIVMPYLTGTEVSADCLYMENESIIIPRFKESGRFYTIKYDSEILSLCEKFLKKSGLKMPCNIQFKYEDSRPYLLEVNTRMSGGVQLSCLGAGVNIPRAALDRLCGIENEICTSKEEKTVSYIEQPILLG